jgi:hypothetical protein
MSYYSLNHHRLKSLIHPPTRAQIHLSEILDTHRHSDKLHDVPDIEIIRLLRCGTECLRENGVRNDYRDMGVWSQGVRTVTVNTAPVILALATFAVFPWIPLVAVRQGAADYEDNQFHIREGILYSLACCKAQGQQRCGERTHVAAYSLAHPSQQDIDIDHRTDYTRHTMTYTTFMLRSAIGELEHERGCTGRC